MLVSRLFHRRGFVRSWLRVACFFGVTSGVSVGLLFNTARAAVERRAEDLGKKLAQSLGPLVIGEPQTLNVNGQSLYLASTVTPLEPSQVLERFEGYCRAHAGDPGAEIAGLPKASPADSVPAELRDPAGWMTMRSPAADDGGHIACFAEGEAKRAPFLERLVAFMETDDVASFGNFRYVVARRTQQGRTHVLSLWTEGSLRLGAMFPDSGDAPGRDARDAPRPPNSVRLLSAELADQPYAVRVYESSDDPEKVLGAYDAPMRKNGFEALPAWLENEDDPKPTAAPSYGRAFAKAGGVLLVTAVEEPISGQGSQVTIIEMASRGAVSVPSVDP